MRLIRVGVAFTTSVGVLAGCGQAIDTSPRGEVAGSSGAHVVVSPSQERADSGLQWRMRWREDGAVDLSSPTATFIRAAMEAYYLVLFDWDPEEEFPGLKEAAPVWWNRDIAPSNSPFNTADVVLKIASVQKVGADHASALICHSGKTASSESEFPGYFDPANPPDVIQRGVKVVRLAFERTGTAPPDGLAGDRLFPGSNVFGDWRLTEFKSTWAPNVPGEAAPDRSTCGDMGDLTAPGPSYPGWPDAGV